MLFMASTLSNCSRPSCLGISGHDALSKLPRRTSAQGRVRAITWKTHHGPRRAFEACSRCSSGQKRPGHAPRCRELEERGDPRHAAHASERPEVSSALLASNPVKRARCTPHSTLALPCYQPGCCPSRSPPARPVATQPFGTALGRVRDMPRVRRAAGRRTSGPPARIVRAPCSTGAACAERLAWHMCIFLRHLRTQSPRCPIPFPIARGPPPS